MKNRSVLALTLAGLCAACGPTWVDFTAPDGSFTGSFPEPPTLKDSGSSKIWHSSIGKTTFNVVVQQVPAEFAAEPAADPLFDQLVKVHQKSCRGPMSDVVALTLGPQAIPGRGYRCVASTPAGDANRTTRAYRAKDRLFILLLMEPVDQKAVDATRFWDSFAIPQ